MKQTLIIFTLSIALFATKANAIEYPSQSITLKNGLKVIVCEKKDNDFVEFEVWYRTGSKDEKHGIRGMAHLFEHMMFRGTNKYPGNSFFDTVQKIGGNINAYTTFDRTVYHEYIPSSSLERLVDMEADRMSNLMVTQNILDTEREVVGEELRNQKSNWKGKIDFDRYPYLYPTNHPYQVDVIGYLDEITKFTSNQCMDFYNNYYSPNNAYIVVVGNVKASEVFALTEKYFGVLTKQLNIKPKENIPSLDTAKIRISTMDISLPLQIYTYIFPKPATTDKDFFAYSLLTNLLFTDNNSILNTRLVKKDHLIYGIIPNSDEYSLYPNFSMMDVVMNAAPGNVRIKKVIRDEIAKLIEQGTSPETITNHANASSNLNQLQDYDCDNIASRLGIAEYYFNDYQKAYTIIDEYKKITSDDLKRVAAKYLAEDQIQIINIRPEQ